MFVSLGAMSTAPADEFCLRDPVLTRCMPTVLAAVGGVPGVDLDPYTPSVFRFGAQYTEETTPARISDRSVQPGLRTGAIGQVLPGVFRIGYRFGPPNHVGDLQVLHHQHVIPCDQFTGLFVVKVFALVGDLPVPSRDGFPFGLTVLAASAGPRQPLLRRGELIGSNPGPPRVVDVLTVAGVEPTRRNTTATTTPSPTAADRQTLDAEPAQCGP